MLFVCAPQLEQREEIGLLIAKRRMFLIGLGLLVGGTVARIRHGERRGDDRHFLEAVLLRAREQDAAEPRIER